METLIYILLTLTSMLGVTFIVERGMALRWRKVVPPEVEHAVERYSYTDDLPELKHLCEKNPSPLSRLLLVASDHLHWPKAENIDAVQTRARHEVVQLERGLVVLEIVVGIAPLLGLVGAVYGLIDLFSDLNAVGMEDQVGLARGIAIALRATLMGLLIAIPALVAWSYYNKKVESLTVELETLCDEFLRRNYRHERKG